MPTGSGKITAINESGDGYCITYVFQCHGEDMINGFSVQSDDLENVDSVRDGRGKPLAVEFNDDQEVQRVSIDGTVVLDRRPEPEI